jgi:flagellin-specific chaperone FliS
MTYHYQPQQEYEQTKIERILKELQSIIDREKKRHMMDEHLSHSMRDLLEYEIIPLLEAEVNYDPTPQTSYDFFHQ